MKKSFKFIKELLPLLFILIYWDSSAQVYSSNKKNTASDLAPTALLGKSGTTAPFNGATSASVSSCTPITITLSYVDESCQYAQDGAINMIYAANGNPSPFTFLWSNGATTQNIDNLSAGTYSVVVTAANGCSDTASFNLGVNSPNNQINFDYLIKRHAKGTDNQTSDRGGFNKFGSDVAINGIYAVVGDSRDGSPAVGTPGAAYVFKKVSGSWTQIKKLVPSNSYNGDIFGAAVAIDGSTIAVVGENRDVIYIFEKNQGGTDNWGQTKRIVPNDPSSSNINMEDISISGDNIVAGNPTGTISSVSTGVSYIFNRNFGGTNNWGQVQKINAESNDLQTGDLFGNAVDIFNQTIIIGASSDNQSDDSPNFNTNILQDAGSAYIFEYNSTTSTWVLIKKLIVPSGRSTNDYFGRSVSVNANYISIGATDYNDMGGVFIYEKSSGTWGSTPTQIVPNNLSYQDGFGMSVSLSGNSLLVGSSNDDYNAFTNIGSAYLFRKNSSGNWIQAQTFQIAIDGNGGDHFGNSVAIDKSDIIIGAPSNENDESTPNVLSNLEGAGAVYFYEGNCGCPIISATTIVENESCENTKDGAISLIIEGGASVYSSISFSWTGPNGYTANTQNIQNLADGTYSVDIIADGCTTTVTEIVTDLSTFSPYSTAPYFTNLTAVKRYMDTDNNSANGVQYLGHSYAGSSVDIDGDYAIVGAPYEDVSGYTDAGAAYVFDNNGQVARLTMASVPGGLVAGARFGLGVAIDGNMIAVGAYNKNSQKGAIYIFQFTGVSVTYLTHFEPTDLVNGDAFGYNISISGDFMIVSAHGYDIPAGASGVGAVYIFERQGGAWSQVQKIYSPNPTASGIFGVGLAMKGSYAVVGEPGANKAYVLHRDNTGSWGIVNTLNAPASGSFGTQVDMTDDFIIVGAPNVSGGGAAYIYQLTSTGWNTTSIQTLTNPTSGTHLFGTNVSIDGGMALVSAPKEDFSTYSDPGAAYLFQLSGTSWNYTQRIQATDPASIANFGHDLAISHGNIVVGAPYVLSNVGAAYFFYRGCECKLSVSVPAGVSCSGYPNYNHCLTASVSSGDAPYSYLWGTNPYPCSGVPTGQTTPTICSLNTSCSYIVTVTDAFGCTASTSAGFTVIGTVDYCEGASEMRLLDTEDLSTDKFASSSIHIFPNPTSGNLTIDLGEIYEDVQITIMDVTGKTIQTQTFNQNTNLLDLTLDAPSGMYLLNINTGAKQTTFKLIKN